jgi:K+-sensing histidine kinase KdpD
MTDAGNTAHGGYFRKVLEESQRCTLDLLERNNELTQLVARAGQELAELQQQANNLANLYVASYSLHSTLDRRELVASIKEIVANLIGSEEMALFRVDAGRRRLELLDSVGLEPARYQEVPLDRGLVAQAIRSGQPLVVGAGDPRAAGEETLTAVIPLRVVDDVVGAIAIFRLLPQKPVLQDLDRELFDLLASQAGMALHCAELHARVGGVRTPQ